MPAHAVAALLLSVAVFAVFSFLTETEPAISDPIGYLVAGQRLANGEGLTYEDSNNEIAGPFFVMYAFQVARKGDARHYLGFPPGFALLLAAGALLGAIHYIVPLLAGLTVFATYCLGAELTGSRGAGVAAAVFLALTPSFWQFGTAAWSEVPATLAVVTGFLLYLRSRNKPKRAGLLSLTAALTLSFGHLIRYSNVTFLGALAIYELYTARRLILSERWRWTFWIAIVAGLVAIPVFNHFYYGGALITSYSPLHGWYPHPPFSLTYALGPSFVNGYSLRESGRTLWLNFGVLLLVATVGWWKMTRAGRVLVGAAIAFGLFPYAVYAFAPVDINSRFLLPIFPFVSVAAGYALVLVFRRVPSPLGKVMAGVLVAVVALYMASSHWDTLTQRNFASSSTIAHVDDLTTGMEPDAVVLSYSYNDMIAVYGGRSVLNYRRIPVSDANLGRFRREMLEPCLVGAIDRLLANSVPVYYIEDQQPSYWGSLEILQRHYLLSEPVNTPPVYRVIERIDRGTFDETDCRFPE